VVFQRPRRAENQLIKRIVGLPGDTVEYKDKVLKVNGNIVETDTPDGRRGYRRTLRAYSGAGGSFRPT